MSGISDEPRWGKTQNANFDRIARVYRWAEYLMLGPLLRRTRECLLPAITHQRNALLLGDGDGRFAAKLLRSSPNLRVHAADTSKRMLQLLHRRCALDGSAGRLTTEQTTALRTVPDPACDLVVTHFFLDCLSQTEVDALTCRLARQLRPGTLWLISDFAVPARRLWQPVGAGYIRLLYLAFRLLTGLQVRRLPDIAGAMHAAGWVRTRRRQRLGGLLYSELWQLPADEGEIGRTG